MKKLLCLIMVSLLIAIPLTGHADDNSISFEPSLAKAVGFTTDNWYSSGTSRALLTVLLAINASYDSSNGYSDILNMLSNTTYVGRSSSFLAVMGSIDGKEVIITYSPLLNMANYTLVDTQLSGSLLEMAMEAAMSSTCTDGYQKNNSQDILNCLSEISELIK